LHSPFFEVDDAMGGLEREGLARADRPATLPFGEAPEGALAELSPVAGTSA